MTFLWKRMKCPSSYSPMTLLYEYASRLGTPIAYKGEREGQFIHDIRASKNSLKYNHTSLGNGSLGLHTEMAFHHIRPRFVLLYCVQNKFTKTHVVTTSDILSSLDACTITTLRQPGFQLHSPPSFRDIYPVHWSPLLDSFGKLRFASHANMTFLDTQFYNTYAKMLGVAHTRVESFILQPSELLVINNDLVHHGRDNIHPLDKDRLLYRMYVI